MTTVVFSQCTNVADDYAKEMVQWPIIPRIKHYRKTLAEWAGRGSIYETQDELFILVAQQLKREKVLSSLTLLSVCECEGEHKETVIETDGDGDMLAEPHHGFFYQRLELLR